MNKILRISMIAVLALIANFSFAGVSTIDFTKLTVTTVSDENNKENNGYTFTSGDFTFTAKKNNGQTAPTHETHSLQTGMNSVAAAKTMGFSVLQHSSRFPSGHFHPSM